MSITDELREYAHDCCARVDDAIHAIADRIDAEHERLMQEQPYTIDMVPMTDESMAEHGWARLPKDADGVPWHIGDRDEGRQRGHPTKAKFRWMVCRNGRPIRLSPRAAPPLPRTHRRGRVAGVY